jgi:hypothetical protein
MSAPIANPIHNATTRPEGEFVHACAVIGLGSTSLGALLAAEVQRRKSGLLAVPHRYLGVDSVPYEAARERAVGEGFNRELFEDVLPRERFYQLKSPIDASFDFEDPRNRQIRDVLFTEALQLAAKKAGQNGCAGTRAVGRAWCEQNVAPLTDWLTRHLRDLTRVGEPTIDLAPGIWAHVIAAFRSGTACGAIDAFGAITREALANVGATNSRVHAIIAQPDIYGGDQRAEASAHAALMETCKYHSLDSRGVPIAGRSYPAGFDEVTLLFASDGARTISPIDARYVTAAAVVTFLSADTQKQIATSRVNSTVAATHDAEGAPFIFSHLATVTIEARPAIANRYMGLVYLSTELEKSEQRVRALSCANTLTPPDKAEVDEAIKLARDTLKLDLDLLLRRLDGEQSSSSIINAAFERYQPVLALSTEEVQAEMPSLMPRMRDDLAKLEKRAADNANALSRELTFAVAQYVVSLANKEALALAVVDGIAAFLDEDVRKQAAERAKTAQLARQKLNSEYGQRSMDVANAKRAWLLNKDEEARDAAHAMLDAGRLLMGAARDQMLAEKLGIVLQHGLTEQDANGRTTTSVPGVVAALRAYRQKLEVDGARRHRELARIVSEQMSTAATALQLRSPTFEHFLQLDEADEATLRANTVAFVATLSAPLPPFEKLRRGEVTVEQALAELEPSMPGYAIETRIEDILQDDPNAKQRAMGVLRNARPFAPLDDVVLDQQGLRDRRDYVRIIVCPGGETGTIGSWLKREDIVDHRTQIVGGKANAIRLFYVREHLPAYAFAGVERLARAYDRYLASPAAITPHSHKDGQRMPRIRAPRVSLRDHVEGLFVRAAAVLPARIERTPSGYLVRYSVARGGGFATEETVPFTARDQLMHWLETNASARAELEREIERHWQTQGAEHVTKLRTAYGDPNLPPEDKDALFRVGAMLRIDVRGGASPSAAGKEQKQ